MKIKTLNVQAEYLKALPNYSNIKFIAGASAEIGEDEKPSDVYKKLWDITTEEINKQLEEFDGKHKK